MGVVALLAENLWFLTIVALAIYAIDRYYTYNRLKAFRGPFSTGFSDLWHSWALLTLRSHLIYGKITEKYGTIARVGPNHLITSSPELWAHVNAVRSPYTRSPWFYHAARFQPGKDHVFSECDDKKHENRRKQMAAGYSGKENLHLESSIDARVQDLLELIRTKYLSSKTEVKPMDLARKVQYFTLDVISDVGLGQSFGDLKADADLDNFIKSAEEGLFVANTVLALGINWLIQIPWLGNLVGPSERDESGFGKMMATARRHVDARLSSPTNTRSDMLASFIRHGLNREELFSESLEQILAGHDTTASGLRAIMLYLITNPRVYRTLQAEIDAAVLEGKAPPYPGIIPDSETRQLRYLQAVIREGLRMHPPVASIFSKEVPPGGDTVVVDGKTIFLPGGTKIGYSAWGIHHNKAVFGDDALDFRPERWLIEDDEKNTDRLVAMIRTNDMIFGYGKWQCLGKNVAMLEISKAVFELLRNFDWGLINPEKPWTTKNLMGLFEHAGMWVQVTARTSVG